MLSAPILRSTRSGRLVAVAAVAALGLTACAGEEEQVESVQGNVSVDRVSEVEKSEADADGAAERQSDAAEKSEAEAAEEQDAAEKAEAEKAAEQAHKKKVYEYRRAKKARIEAREQAEAEKAAEQAHKKKVNEYRRAKQARIEAREAEERAAAEAAQRKAAQEKAAQDAWAKKVAEREAAEKAWAEKVAQQRAAEKQAAEEAQAQRAAQQRVATERTSSTTTSNDSVWDRLAHCESGGDWSINTGNGFYGGIQFKQDVWVANGGTQYAPMPHMATREEQIIMGKKIHAIAGWGAWPGCKAKLGLN